MMIDDLVLNPLIMKQDEYVRGRFNAMPKEMVEFLHLNYDDARVSLENEFRSEWYRIRHDAIQEIVSLLHNKLNIAKKMLINMGMSEDDIDTTVKKSLTVEKYKNLIIEI